MANQTFTRGTNYNRRPKLPLLPSGWCAGAKVKDRQTKEEWLVVKVFVYDNLDVLDEYGNPREEYRMTLSRNNGRVFRDSTPVNFQLFELVEEGPPAYGHDLFASRHRRKEEDGSMLGNLKKTLRKKRKENGFVVMDKSFRGILTYEERAIMAEIIDLLDFRVAKENLEKSNGWFYFPLKEFAEFGCLDKKQGWYKFERVIKSLANKGVILIKKDARPQCMNSGKKIWWIKMNVKTGNKGYDSEVV